MVVELHHPVNLVTNVPKLPAAIQWNCGSPAFALSCVREGPGTARGVSLQTITLVVLLTFAGTVAPTASDVTAASVYGRPVSHVVAPVPHQLDAVYTSTNPLALLTPAVMLQKQPVPSCNQPDILCCPPLQGPHMHDAVASQSFWAWTAS